MWFVAAALAQSYSTTELTVQVPKRSNAEWAQQLQTKARMRKKKLTWVWRDPESGEETPVLEREGGTGELGRPALVASFALFKLDPDALRRISPEALAWFESGGHLPQ